jgi:hypothetical protein
MFELEFTKNDGVTSNKQLLFDEIISEIIKIENRIDQYLSYRVLDLKDNKKEIIIDWTQNGVLN